MRPRRRFTRRFLNARGGSVEEEKNNCNFRARVTSPATCSFKASMALFRRFRRKLHHHRVHAALAFAMASACLSSAHHLWSPRHGGRCGSQRLFGAICTDHFCLPTERWCVCEFSSVCIAKNTPAHTVAVARSYCGCTYTQTPPARRRSLGESP